MGKQERQDRQTRRAKKWGAKKGLLWSDDESVRTAANAAGLLAMLKVKELTSEELLELRSPEDIVAANPSASDLEAAYVYAYNQVILASREPEAEPEPEAPRAQVDIDQVGKALPWQAVAMTGGDKPATPWWMWAAPAGLLFLFFQRGK